MPTPLRRLMRITPQQLRAFEAVARLGSITNAARELHVSQPTVSIQLRELANAVGEPLVEINGRRLRLTHAGDVLQGTIGELGQCWQRLESSLAEARGLVRGRLRIAAVTTAEYFVPDLLGMFAAAHPGVEIELAIENRDRVVERLQRNLDDLTVMMLPPASLSLERVPFLDNPLVVIAARQHPLQGRALTLDELSEQRWLMREQGSGTRKVAEQHFTEAGFVPKVAMSLGSNEAIKHAAAAGLGVAVVSELAVRVAGMLDPALTILNVHGFPLQRQWFVVWRKDQHHSVAAKRFVQYLQTRVNLDAYDPGDGA